MFGRIGATILAMATNEESRELAPAAEVDRRRDLNRELRAAFLAGAEERSRREQCRGLTEGELQAVLRRPDALYGTGPFAIRIRESWPVIWPHRTVPKYCRTSHPLEAACRLCPTAW